MFLGAALGILLVPIVFGGAKAFFFRATVEHRRLILEKFERGSSAALEAERAQAAEARKPVYEMIALFEKELKAMSGPRKSALKKEFKEVEGELRDLLGPAPGEPLPALVRSQYGQTRWDRAQAKLQEILYAEEYDYSNPAALGRKMLVPRVERFRGTALEPVFGYIEIHAEAMLRPRWTFYWRFLFDDSLDSHMFGGIWAEMLGTLYLTLGAMLFAVPLGVASAIYLTEYARQGRVIGILRTCVNTLAGVPSIVFGLFGLAFFINTLRVSESKSVLAGSLTLAFLVLPVIIRASEEAILAVSGIVPRSGLEPGIEPMARDCACGSPRGSARHPHGDRHWDGPRRRRDGADHLHRRRERREAACALANVFAADPGAVLEHLQSGHRARSRRPDPACAIRHGSRAGWACSGIESRRHFHACPHLAKAQRVRECTWPFLRSKRMSSVSPK